MLFISPQVVSESETFVIAVYWSCCLFKFLVKLKKNKGKNTRIIYIIKSSQALVLRKDSQLNPSVLNETSGHLQLCLWRQKLTFLTSSRWYFQLCPWRQNWLFLMRPQHKSRRYSGNKKRMIWKDISFVCDDQNRYFKLRHHHFLTLTECFLCLDLTRV